MLEQDRTDEEASCDRRLFRFCRAFIFFTKPGAEMKILDQAEIFCTVNRKKQELISETIFIGRDLEAKASLSVDVGSFLIQDAVWEIHRAPGDIAVGCGNAASLLTGVSAHIEGRKEMKRLMRLDGGIALKYLFTDCIKSLVQAETYVYRERGFADEEAYNIYWDRIEKNGCRAYTYPNEADLRWMDYIPHGPRKDNLFNRGRHYLMMETGEGQIEIVGGFHDTYHELGLKMTLKDLSGIVSRCEIDYARAPGSSCFNNRIHADKFAGKNITAMTKDEIIRLAGGGEGCYHLVDLLSDAVALFAGKNIFSRSVK
jgi:hypothetical protein